MKPDNCNPADVLNITIKNVASCTRLLRSIAGEVTKLTKQSLSVASRGNRDLHTELKRSCSFTLTNCFRTIKSKLSEKLTNNDSRDYDRGSSNLALTTYLLGLTRLES